jgi:hypothetical protein
MTQSPLTSAKRYVQLALYSVFQTLHGTKSYVVLCQFHNIHMAQKANAALYMLQTVYTAHTL